MTSFIPKLFILSLHNIHLYTKISQLNGMFYNIEFVSKTCEKSFNDVHFISNLQ